MSIYDKYFSERNKTHMFSLVRDIIVREVAHDINHDPPYQDLFHGQYVRVFEETQGETLVDCNRDVIDRICPLIIEDIQRKRGGTTDSEAMMTRRSGAHLPEIGSPGLPSPRRPSL